jgi:hypothetical protein
MTQLSDIRPLTRRLVYDLAQEAGFDTSDWLASSNDSLRPKANPKYCYEWAYEEPGKLIVLNLWHEEMAEEDGRIVQRGNMRSEAGAHREAGGRQQWINRALRFDGALQSALRGGLPVRVIVLTRTAEKADPAKPSRVAFRALDDEPWTITNYDWISGEYELTRGLPYVDQFDITEAVGSTVERHEFSGSAFARDGAVRDRVLRRARGRCELCGELGFVTFGGRLYLETHHVVPLCEGGADEDWNVVAICAHDHRRAHHAHDREAIRIRLHEILRARLAA